MTHIFDDEKGGNGVRIVNGELWVTVISGAGEGTLSGGSGEIGVVDDTKDDNGAQVIGGALQVLVVP
jgi:hypothetical protein